MNGTGFAMGVHANGLSWAAVTMLLALAATQVCDGEAIAPTIRMLTVALAEMHTGTNSGGAL